MLQRKLLATICLALLALMGPALAQSNFATPGGSEVDGKVMMCLNAQGVAVPATSAGTCPTGSAAWVPPASYISGTTAAMTGTTSTQLIAGVATKQIFVLSISCVNSSATGTFVTVQDGSAGTAKATLAAGPTFGGDEKTSVGPLFATTAGNGLYVADVTTGANVICNASGFAQ